MKKSKFKTIVFWECVICAALAIIMRVCVFGLLSGESMMHIRIATHALMIGLTASIFTLFALTVKRAWKTHGKYIALPLIFTLFGVLLNMAAYGVDF